MPQHSATASLQCLHVLNESARLTLALYGDPHAFAAHLQRVPGGQEDRFLRNLHEFKAQINEPTGQEMRIVIKKSVQSVDPEWLITILRIMKMKKLVGGIANPWNAFQSAFAEQPFEVYAMTRRQVSMFYHTTKDHLARHVEALSVRPTGSLWDYVPEPRLHAAQPQANDAHAMNAGADDPADEGYFTADEGDNAVLCEECSQGQHPWCSQYISPLVQRLCGGRVRRDGSERG